MGFMPRKNVYSVSMPVDPEAGGCGCPKCGAEMEPIEMGMAGPPIQQLQLCPGCYLVTWSDQDGLHFRQGMPVKEGVDPRKQPRLLAGEPEEC